MLGQKAEVIYRPMTRQVSPRQVSQGVVVQKKSFVLRGKQSVKYMRMNKTKINFLIGDERHLVVCTGEQR